MYLSHVSLWHAHAPRRSLDVTGRQLFRMPERGGRSWQVWRERAPSPTPEVPEVPEVPAAAAPEVLEAMPEHLWIVFSEAPELEARWVYGRRGVLAVWTLLTRQRICKLNRGVL